MNRSESTGADALERAMTQGMVIALVAQRLPDKVAVASPFGELTFAQLNARVNRLARLMRAHGIGATGRRSSRPISRRCARAFGSRRSIST